MNEKLQFIREKCIAANPEIVELKFGCLLNNIHRPSYPITMFLWKVGEQVMTFHPQFDQELVKDMHSLEIFGRPIRLADVLLAIGCNSYTVPKDRFRDGNSLYSGDWNANGQIMWNLRADDLEKQSQETVDFLYELLK